jgi:hypothetical protein
MSQEHEHHKEATTQELKEQLNVMEAELAAARNMMALGYKVDRVPVAVPVVIAKR